jgi:hypothetical protein
MKTLNFAGKETNLYHTLKEHSINVTGQIKSGLCTITGFSIQDLEIDDTLNINGVNYVIVEVLERRNHAGEFLDPESKVNTFFKVETKFEKLIQLK